MADNILQLKIMIDGKEAMATLDQSQLRLKNFKEETAGAGAAGSKTTGDLKSMQMAVGQFGWVLGDANMFLVNFRMGLMSIGNNIPMVVQYMAEAKQEANALGITIGQSLVKSLMGPAGLMLAVNGAMLLLQILPSLFGKTTEAVKEQVKSVKDLRNEYSGLTRAAIDAEIAKRDAEIAILDMYPGEKFHTTERRAKPDIITDEDRYGDKLDLVNKLKRENIALEQVKFNTNDLSDAERRLSENRKKYGMVNEDNFKRHVEGAKTLSEAMAMLAQWIRADEALVKRQTKPISAIDTEKEKAKQAKKELDELTNKQEQQIKGMEIAKSKEWKIELQQIKNLEEEIELRKNLGLEYRDQANALANLKKAMIAFSGENMKVRNPSGKIGKFGLVNGNVNEGFRLEAKTGKEGAMKETTAELQAQLFLMDAWKSAASEATDALASGLTENIQLFGKADNALSSFANKFIQILLQKAILGFVNMMTGGFGSLLGGLFGAPVSGVGGGLSTLNSSAALSSSSSRLLRIEVQADTRLKGGDIYLAWKGERNYKERYT
jgi:hypothetical protein